MGLAMASGVLLSAAFPPIEAGGIAWVALIPLLLIPIPRVMWRRLVIGYAFGIAHFITSLWWLNEVGFGAGILLAVVCAVFPMVWYLFFAALANALPSLARRAGNAVEIPRLLVQARPLEVAWAALLIAAGWCSTEWIRSWIFTGFSWNQLGISQWRHAAVLKLTTLTGVYGISFLIVFSNIALVWLLLSWLARFKGRRRRGIPWPPAVAVVMFSPIFMLLMLESPLPAPDRYLEVAGIQGNLSQRRDPDPGQFDEALEVYERLSLEAAEEGGEGLDLIVWPETAIPAPLEWNERAAAMLARVLEEVQTHMLVGSLAYREDSAGAAEMRMVNSALLLDPNAGVVDYYDKIHLVPFGEFVPFGKQMPWLVDMIGMGRGLLAGKEYTVLNLPKEARAGVNICYEDAYPEISRRFVQRGANLLFTLTNDAWYAESAGSKQHLTHAVFRAVENRRPLFRSGNNSDTCLILPSGKIEGLLYDSENETFFVRTHGLYSVPVWDELPTTLYTRFGDWFAKICALAFLGASAVLAVRTIRRKHENFQAIASQF